MPNEQSLKQEVTIYLLLEKKNNKKYSCSYLSLNAPEQFYKKRNQQQNCPNCSINLYLCKHNMYVYEYTHIIIYFKRFMLIFIIAHT